MVGFFKFDMDKVMSAGNSIFILGIAWLLFWLGPAFFLFREDPRWGHNFALPLTFITAGLASNTRIISCQLIAVTSAFFLVPTLLAYWSWAVATMISGGLLGIFLILYVIEARRETELIVPNTRLRTWLKIHLLTFAYLGLAHMSLIFYLVRWTNPDSFAKFLPMEHEISTSVFNAMLITLVILAIVERFVKKIGNIQVAKAGFIWAVLMIVIPLISINLLGQ
jgi:hypothetical protein